MTDFFSVLMSTQAIGSPAISAGIHNLLLSILTILLGLASWGVKVLKDWIDVQVATHTHGLQGMIAKRIVAFVEQKATDTMTNQDKLNQAVALIQKECPRLSLDDINPLVEEAVSELKSNAPAPVAPADNTGGTK